MKKLAYIFLFSFSLWAHGEEIKLSCNLDITDDYSSGNSEKKSITDVIEVTITPNAKFIIPQVLASASAVPATYSKDNSAADQSDSNKWSIIQKRQYTGNISSTEASIVIDRNVGFITYDYLTKFKNGTWIRTYGNGNCQKIDTTKKKF
jgi:hypothetical protein